MKKLLNLSFLALISTCTILADEDGSKEYQKCIVCHGKNGEKIYLNKIPAINNLDFDTFVKYMNEYKNGTRNQYKLAPVMRAYVTRIDSEKIEAIAKFLDLNRTDSSN